MGRASLWKSLKGKNQPVMFSTIKEGCDVRKKFECHMGWDLQEVGKSILLRTYFWSCCGKSLCRQILLWGKLTPCREGGLAHLELRINTWQESKLHQGSVSGLGMSVLQRLTHMLSFLHMNVLTLIHGCKHMRVCRIRTSVPFFCRSHGSFSDCKRAGRVLSRTKQLLLQARVFWDQHIVRNMIGPYGFLSQDSLNKSAPDN